MRGCEELHVECADKTHYIVEHCNCSPSNPDMAHRHIFEYCDLLEPPTTGRVKQADIGHFDVDVLRRLLIISHPHYSTLSRTATHRSSIVATSVNEDSNGSSEDSFEIQIRTTTPDVDLLSNTFFKNRRESQDARDMLSQVSFWPFMSFVNTESHQSKMVDQFGGIRALGIFRIRLFDFNFLSEPFEPLCICNPMIFISPLYCISSRVYHNSTTTTYMCAPFHANMQ